MQAKTIKPGMIVQYHPSNTTRDDRYALDSHTFLGEVLVGAELVARPSSRSWKAPEPVELQLADGSTVTVPSGFRKANEYNKATHVLIRPMRSTRQRFHRDSDAPVWDVSNPEPIAVSFRDVAREWTSETETAQKEAWKAAYDYRQEAAAERQAVAELNQQMLAELQTMLPEHADWIANEFKHSTSTQVTIAKLHELITAARS